MTIKYLDSKRISALSSDYTLGTNNGTIFANWDYVVYGGSAEFDGSNDNIKFGDNTDWNFMHNSGSWTASFWMKPDVLSDRMVFNTNGTTNTNIGVQCIITSSNALRTRIGNGSGDWVTTTHGSFSVNTWYFVVITFDGTTLSVKSSSYGGSLSSATTGTVSGSASSANSLSPMTLGSASDSNTTYPFDGHINVFMIWDRVLTSAEINTLHGGGTGSTSYSESGLVLRTCLQITGESLQWFDNQVVKPTNVQDNSILVEKDTGRRYWFDDAFNKTGLKAYYKFDETSGNLINQSTSVGSADSLGTNADGTASGNPTYSETGVIDSAINFDGVGDYFELGSSNSQWNFLHNDSAHWTLSFWMKLNSIEPSSTVGIMGTHAYSASSNVGMGLFLRDDSAKDHMLEVQIGNVNANPTAFTSSASYIPKNTTTWYHYIITNDYDGTNNINIYRDNANNESGTIAGTNTNGNSDHSMLLALDAVAQGRFSDCLFDEFSFWDRVITADERAELYNSGTGKTIDTAGSGATWTRSSFPTFTPSYFMAGGTNAPWTPVNFHDQFNGTTWVTASNLTTAVSLNAGAGTKTDGAIFGGDTSGTATPVNKNQYWLGSSWVNGTAMNTTRNQTTGGGEGSTSGWVAGGRVTSSGNPVNTTEQWNGIAWSTGGNMSGVRRNSAGAGIVTEAWNAGGYTGSVQLDTMELYNGTAWSAGSNIHSVTDGLCQGGGDSYNCFYVGGNEAAGTLDHTHIYNGTSWSLGNPLTFTVKYNATMGTPQGAITACGFQPNGSGWAGVWAATYDGTSWTSSTNVTRGRGTGAGGT